MVVNLSMHVPHLKWKHSWGIHPISSLLSLLGDNISTTTLFIFSQPHAYFLLSAKSNLRFLLRTQGGIDTDNASYESILVLNMTCFGSYKLI